MQLDPAARAGVSSRRLPSGNMKPIAPLLAVLSLAVIVTGCETTRKESCCGIHDSQTDPLRSPNGEI